LSPKDSLGAVHAAGLEAGVGHRAAAGRDVPVGSIGCRAGRRHDGVAESEAGI
jgi:hypothetical protein